LGYVPDDPTPSDYYYAEKTSWWGKRLDPQEFWKDKVVWYDKIALFEAQRRGRGYPPMPYEDPSLARRSDVDKKADGTHIEGSTPGFISSDRESVFWDEFRKKHPHPPEEIQRWLRSWVDHYITATTINDLYHPLNDVRTFGYPKECVTPEVFRWDHVMRKRAEYEIFLSEPNKDSLSFRLFFNRVKVNHALITEPLTQEQIDAANAWKVKYLNRLRSEQRDESYINAYLQTWDLTEEYVFGEKEEAK